MSCTTYVLRLSPKSATVITLVFSFTLGHSIVYCIWRIVSADAHYAQEAAFPFCSDDIRPWNMECTIDRPWYSDGI